MMATAEDYAAWIVKNQDKRGTPEFETVAQAYKLAKGSGAAEKVANDAITQGAKNFNADAGFGQNLRAGIGAGMHGVAQGLGQLVGATSQADIDETKRLNQPLGQTGGGKVGEITGNVAMLAPTAFIPGANTMVGAGLIGATIGALTTPGSVVDRGAAAVFSGAGGMAGQAIPRVLGSIKAAAQPFTQSGRDAIVGRLMNRTVGDDAAQVAARMKAAQPLLPGSMPTAAEVAESGGIAALQRAMSAADPQAYTHRGMEQASARLNALRGIAGDDAKMAAAEAARDAATSTLYRQADAGVAPLDSMFNGLLQRPQFKAAVDRAAELAKDKGLTDIFFRDAKGKPVALIGEGAHFIKKALDEAGEFGSKSYTGKQSAGAANSTNEIFQTWLEKSIPEYSAAKAAYAAGSRPINQMQVGQKLLNDISPALADHGALAKETASKYALALRNSEQTANTATGFRQGLDAVMDPGQMDILNRIAQDLARKSNAQDLGRGVGSNTFQNLAMDNLSASVGGPGVLRALGAIPGVSPTATLVSKGIQGGLGFAYKNADELMRKDIAQALLNPKAAARLMESAANPGMVAQLLQKSPQKLQNVIPPEDLIRLLQASPGVVGAATVPAMMGGR